MVKYTCKKCSKDFNRKADYERHLQNKNGCSFSKTKRSIPDSFICKNCKKSFTRKDNLNCHLKKCIVNTNATHIGTIENISHSKINITNGNKNIVDSPSLLI